MNNDHLKGKRGRKPGIPNKRTREIQAKADALGVTPLDVLIEGTAFHYRNFKKLEKELKGRNFVTDEEKHNLQMSLNQARVFANDAAPYVHAKLANVSHTGKDGGPLNIIISSVDEDL